MILSVKPFGKINERDGTSKDIYQYTLSNKKLILDVINYGATITSLKVPDKSCDRIDVVLGFDNLLDYVSHPHYFGCTIGRYANRIAKGKFTLGDKLYSLALNNGPSHLHGGIQGFDKAVWSATASENKIIFSYLSPSMEEHYPGDLSCEVTYEITNETDLVIHYKASSTHMTPVNLTNHSYFNLAGHNFGSIDDHVISLNADYYLPDDEEGIPTGIIQEVEASNFDLRKKKTFKELFDAMNHGFDHNFCINKTKGEKEVASVYHPKSGISMQMTSTQPGVQLYTANFLPEDNSLCGKDGAWYKKHGAFCLETQNYPNAINQANFPKAYIDVGEVYEHSTRLSFDIL